MTDRPPAAPAVLISGGSGGIGAALARRAAAAGWQVVIGFDRGEERAATLAGEIAAGGGLARTLRLPLADPEAVATALAELVAGGTVPQAAVLAGSPPPEVAAFTRVGADAFRRQFEVAVIGHHRLIAELWKAAFRRRGGGHVVAVLTSALGPPPTAHMAPYVVAKAALQTLLACALAEFGSGGLAASVISPGYTETPMLQAFESHFLELARKAAGGSFLSPETVAAAILAGLQAPPPPGTLATLPLPPAPVSRA